MWQRITNRRQIRSIGVGDSISISPEDQSASFIVNVKVGNDLVVVREKEYREIKLLTAEELLSGGWCVFNRELPA